MKAARSSAWTHAKLWVGTAWRSPSRSRMPAGRIEFQIEDSPDPRMAGGRTSTRVSPPTPLSAASASRFVTG